jgi:hypothetical protein
VSAPTQPWVLGSVTASLSDYPPVLALTLVRRAARGRYEVLAGVRTPAANRTHPNVVSVPTLRVPGPVAQQWLADAGRDDVTREVVNLMARKLGVADGLELDRIAIRCHRLDAWQGTSVNGEDENGPVTEDITMFNACVEVVAGADRFPERTASYDPLVWAPVDAFLRMVRTRQVSLLSPDLDELMYCAYGLCLQTTERMLAAVTLP